MQQYITYSTEETKNFAQQFVKNLKDGAVLGLVGTLGAGKTVFVQGLAEALGIKEIVNSPTFVLMKIYKIHDTRYTTCPERSRGIHDLVHIDAYRLDSFEQLRDIGVEEYLNKQDCLVVVEWADKVSEIKKHPKYQQINFTSGKKENQRIIKYLN